MRYSWWILCVLVCALPVNADEIAEFQQSGAEFVDDDLFRESEAERLEREAREVDYAAQRLAAATNYANCLSAAKDQWFGSPDYSSCDGARDSYAAFLPAGEVLAIGCLEEQVIGTPRLEGETCTRLLEAHAREVFIGPRWP